MKITLLELFIFLAAISAAPALNAALKGWSNAGGDTLWSNPANWSPEGVPGRDDNVTFTNAGVGDISLVDGGSANNTVDAAFPGRIKSLRYSNITGFHNTALAKSLVVEGSSADDAGFISDDGHHAILFIGSGQADGAADAVYTSFSGESLTVANPNGVISVMQASEASGAHRATLDLSLLNSFSCTVSNILVGHDFGVPVTRPTGTLILAQTNAITAKLISLSDAYQNAGQISYFYLGQANTLNVDRLRIALHKCVGTLSLRQGLAGGTVKLRAADGSGRQVSWEIGDEYEPDTSLGFYTSGQSTGVMDLSGATVDGLVDQIILGRGQTNAPNRNGDGNGTLTFGAGKIEANRIGMGIQLSAGGSAGRGTLNLNNDNETEPARLRVNGDLVMAVQLPGNTEPTGSTATLNINGGVLEVGGNAVHGGGTVTLTIANGGKVDMQPAGDSTPGNLAVDVLNLSNGSIVNYGILAASTIALSDSATEFSVGPGQTLSPAGDAAGVLKITGGTLRLQGTLLLDVKKSGATLSADSLDGTVIYGGTLQVRQTGDDLALGDKFTLFSAAVPENTFSTVMLPAAGPGLVFTNKLAVDGTIEVVAGVAADRPQLSIARDSSAVVVSWPATFPGYHLRAQTNALSAGVGSNWGLVSGITANSVMLPIGAANAVVIFQLIQQ